MPSFDEHCAESLGRFGRAHEEVHRWLDEFAGKPPYGMKHRRVRHHLAGIEQARRLFGDEGAEAARQHIASDLKMEGWKESDPFPKDERSYVAMGLF